MPHRRRDDDSRGTDEDLVQGQPHVSRRHAANERDERGGYRHRRSHTRKKRNDEEGGRGTRDGKHRRNEHRKHQRKHRIEDEDDEVEDDDDRGHRGKERHRHRHRAHKREGHRHREGHKHRESSKHRSRHSKSSRHHPEEDEEIDEDDEHIDEGSMNRLGEMEMRGLREGDVLRRGLRHEDDDDNEDEDDDDDDEEEAYHASRRRGSSRDNRRGEPLHDMLNRHGRTASGRRLDSNDHRLDHYSEDDNSLHSALHPTRSGRTVYPYERTDFRRPQDLEEADYSSGRSRRHSFSGRGGDDEQIMFREREFMHRGEGGIQRDRHVKGVLRRPFDEARDGGHDAGMGDGYGRGFLDSHLEFDRGSRSRSLSRSRSRMSPRFANQRDRYRDGTRAMPWAYGGQGNHHASARNAYVADRDYPEGTVLSDESRYQEVPVDPRHRTPSGYPTGNIPYDLHGSHSLNMQELGPDHGAHYAGSYMSRSDMRHFGGRSLNHGMLRNRHGDLGYPAEGFGGPSMVSHPEYSMGRYGRYAHPPSYADAQGFDGRSEVSDDLGTAENHASEVRRAYQHRHRSRRHRRNRRTRGRRHHYYHSRHSRRHPRHHRRRRHLSHTRRHQDLDSFSQGGHMSQGVYEGEGGEPQPEYDYLGSEERERLERGERSLSRRNYDNASIYGEEEEEGSGQGKTFTKKNVLRAGLVAAGALAAGLILRKIAKNRKNKKKKEEATSEEGEEDYVSYDENEEPLAQAFKPPPVPHAGLFNVKVPQNQVAIVERGGRYHKKLDAGSHIIVPCLDKVACCHSLRELSIPVPYQHCYTQDNVALQANGIIFMRIEDPVAATYGVDNPYRTIVHLVQTCLRNEIGKLTSHQAMEDRVTISDRVLDHVNDACRPWGVRCLRFELQEVQLPDELRKSLDEEAEADRKKRLQVLEAEAERDAAIKRAEGHLQAQIRQSQARQLDIVNQAIGEAHAIEERGGAIANAMRDVADVIREPGGEQAMQMRIAEQFINAYSNATREPTVHPPQPNSMAANMNNAIDLLNTLGQQRHSTQIPLADLPENPFGARPGEQMTSKAASHVDSDPQTPSPLIANGAGERVISQQSTPKINQQLTPQMSKVKDERVSSRQAETPQSQQAHRQIQVDDVQQSFRSPQVRVNLVQETVVSPTVRMQHGGQAPSPLVQMQHMQRTTRNPHVRLQHDKTTVGSPQVRVEHVQHTSRRTEVRRVRNPQRTTQSAKRTPSLPRPMQK